MGDIHIDDFYKDAGKILALLYRSFPRKTLLFVEDICGPDTPDEYGLHSERHQSCFGAAIWLAESGYLKYSEAVRQEALDQAVLSHKAFTLLSARAAFLPTHDDAEHLPPSVRESQSSNIFLLRDALKVGDSNKIRQIVQHLLVQSRNYA
ncbi:MAG: hypothetical protein AseanaTS_17190 [Candidatus Pelagadaptatus aseana]|uniref:hypothetical protein n=1 Tax=Candidatus Pelagadaptatus aseana TaxID=3120508 RepID=UPI0039B2BAB5